jgi:hypothetical protein
MALTRLAKRHQRTAALFMFSFRIKLSSRASGLGGIFSVAGPVETLTYYRSCSTEGRFAKV